MVCAWVVFSPASFQKLDNRLRSPALCRKHARRGLPLQMALDGMQVHDIDLDLSTSILPLLSEANELARRAVVLADRLNGSVVGQSAGKLRSGAWTVDQALYDAGVRTFVAPRGPEELRDLPTRLPDDAVYWALVPQAAMAKQAKKAAGLYRRSGELVQMVGLVGSAETACILDNAAAKSASARHGIRSADPVKIMLGGTLEDTVAIAKMVREQCSSIRVAAIMMEDLAEDCDDLSLVQQLSNTGDATLELVFTNFIRAGFQSRIKRLKTVLKFHPTLVVEVGK
jgi:hypothetical protein